MFKLVQMLIIGCFLIAALILCVCSKLNLLHKTKSPAEKEAAEGGSLERWIQTSKLRGKTL